MNEDIDLIQCKHGKLPWRIVCVHLINGSSTEWIPIVYSDSDFNDWACPECEKQWDEFMEKTKLDYVAPVCIRCIDDIRCVFDRNYNKEKRQ
jgi:hypothetical protein